MRNRIQSILDHYKISSSKFADTIGVQRSAVSHILSGRNKPGLDFLTKILESYTDLSGDWLVTGKGEMLRKNISPVFKPGNLFSMPEQLQTMPVLEPESRAKEEEPIAYLSPPKTAEIQTEQLSKVASNNNEQREVVRIVFFYSDRSFEAYHP